MNYGINWFVPEKSEVRNIKWESWVKKEKEELK
jgi:hypothetical protein